METETEKEGGVLRAHGYVLAMDVNIDSNSDKVSFLILCNLLLYTDIERMKVFMTISVKVLLSFFHYTAFIHCSFLGFNIFVCMLYIYIIIIYTHNLCFQEEIITLSSESDSPPSHESFR